MIINSPHLEITQGIEQRIKEQFKKVTRKFEATNPPEIYIKQEGREWVCSASYQFHSYQCNATAKSENFDANIVKIVDSLIKQLEKHK